MRFVIQDDGSGEGVLIQEVYSGFTMETTEGNQIGICMRDDTFEINVMPFGKRDENNWWRVNMQRGSIYSMRGPAITAVQRPQTLAPLFDDMPLWIRRAITQYFSSVFQARKEWNSWVESPDEPPIDDEASGALTDTERKQLGAPLEEK